MGTLTLKGRDYDFQWASDVAFDGIRLEILSEGGDMLFDVSMPDKGPITVNTHGQEIAAELLVAAIEVAQSRQ